MAKPPPKHHHKKKGLNPRVLGIESDLDDVILHGRRIREILSNSIVGATLERTIEGASTVTLTVHDPERKVLKGTLLEQRQDITVDGLKFRLVGISKSGNDLDLTFEEKEVAELRLAKGPKKAFRDKITRAEFIIRLVHEVNPKMRLFVPERHKIQPIKNTKGAQSQQRQSSGEQQTQGAHGLGRANMGDITVKGQKASLLQIHYMDIVLDTGMSMGANYRVLVSSIMTIIDESDVSIIRYSGGIGLFSQLPNGAWPASGDPAKDARGYFQVAIREDRKNPHQALTALCHAVQRNADPNVYAQFEHESRHAVDVYLGNAKPGSGPTTITQTVTKRYAFEVKSNESYWSAIQRLAGEVHWRAFVVAGIFYYISEEGLLASMVRAHLTEESVGVDEIDFDYHMGKAVTEVSVTGRAKHWASPPGTVVTVSELGPASKGDGSA